MKTLADFVNEKQNEVDEEIVINITNEITDIIDDIAKRHSPETIQQIIEDVLARYITADPGVSNDTSIAVGDAVLNIYDEYLK
ncbi:MAG: hypothetical protein J1F35_05740 [Erysipelotrichales bacterium]|nr:hypothetical protein [Erysipelotrichales bacterium]